MSAAKQYKVEIKLFSKHLHDLRKQKGLTQNQLRDSSTITQSQISLLERVEVESNPEFDTLVKLAWGLKIEMSFLFLYEVNVNVPSIRKKYTSIEQRSAIEKQLFGKRIEDLRTHRKLIQAELAVLAGIDTGDLSRYINGESNIEFFNILRIAEALEVRIFDLFNFNGPLPDNKFKGKI